MPHTELTNNQPKLAGLSSNNLSVAIATQDSITTTTKYTRGMGSGWGGVASAGLALGDGKQGN